MRFIHSVWIVVCVIPAMAQKDMPKAADPRLVVELVASSPDIVHPISCDFDQQGRLLVIESHTHFAPKDYKGPKHDRIRAFDVKTGKATTFFEGTRHTMDLAVHPDGSVYVATRNEILRLRDTKGTGVADKKTRIVFLDTKGDYPHNGLSGLCFDSKGDLTFGMGENLGAKYTLIGSDGVKFSGEGDGGHIFHCSADGKKLRRVATGFWNPFGICRDIYGRTFAVDNDADQMPPCRMLHVVEGGDYGFRFMYGRSGKHPFQSWNGQLPGTLPMMTGVGEAPCEILSYESDGLPKEYLGQLLVTSWADHRVERYKVVPHGASFKADRQPFVQGGKDFRPVGLCTAPDGSLYVTDWVKSDYTLHGKGAIWRIRWKDAPKPQRPEDPREAILSMHRPLREAAAKKLASNQSEHAFLSKQFEHSDARVRASAVMVMDILQRAKKSRVDWFQHLKRIAEADDDIGLRELVVSNHPLSIGRAFADAKHPANLRRAAIYGLMEKTDRQLLVRLSIDPDPFLQHAVLYFLAMGGDEPVVMDLVRSVGDPKKRLAALRINVGLFDRLLLPMESRAELVREFLRETDESVQFLAVKWIADERIKECRKDIEKAMQDPKLSVRMYLACATALARIDGQEVSETKLADVFAKRLADDATPTELRVQLLKQVPATHSKLTVELLTKLLKADDAALKMEAVRALVEHPNPKRSELLVELFRNPKLATSLRSYATLGMTVQPGKLADELLAIAMDENSPLRFDADRALIDVPFENFVVARVPRKGRPPAKDLDAWLKRLEGPADADAGSRIFAHPKLGQCAKCHRIDGRGQDVGPDLSAIGRTDRRHILESILQPSNTVAPHYETWYLETPDGKTRTGMLVHTHLDEYTYLDPQGGRFKLKTGDLVDQRALPTSIMPDGLVDRMTDQEVRDLLAYLQARK